MLEDRLREWAAGRGYRLAVAGTGVVEVVRDKLKRRRAAGEIEAAFYEETMGWFRGFDASALSGPRRVALVSVPRPVHVLPVLFHGQRFDGLIPPTYVRYNGIFEDVLDDLKRNVLQGGGRAERLKAPLKSLAVHAGLVAQGRNNITYGPGSGSGHQLLGYLVESDEWRAASSGAPAEWRETALERCAECRACVKACPTGAIREDRFLISGERCFTWFSESRKPIPAWVRPPKTLCLIGCMECQRVCPENKGLLKTEASGVEFTDEETAAILEMGRRLEAEGQDKSQRSGSEYQEGAGAVGRSVSESAVSAAGASARAKIAVLGLTEDIEVMGRNLGLFLARL